MKIDHIALIVSSEECISFYEKLGFKDYKIRRFSPLSFKGFGYPIKMKKVITKG